MNPEVKFKTSDYNYYNRAVGIVKKDDKYLILNVDNSDYCIFQVDILKLEKTRL